MTSRISQQWPTVLAGTLVIVSSEGHSLNFLAVARLVYFLLVKVGFHGGLGTRFQGISISIGEGASFKWFQFVSAIMVQY